MEKCLIAFMGPVSVAYFSIVALGSSAVFASLALSVIIFDVYNIVIY